MISRITLQGVASYSAETPQTIEGLLRINCFYGLNGSMFYLELLNLKFHEVISYQR